MVKVRSTIDHCPQLVINQSLMGSRDSEVDMNPPDENTKTALALERKRCFRYSQGGIEKERKGVRSNGRS